MKKNWKQAILGSENGFLNEEETKKAINEYNNHRDDEAYYTNLDIDELDKNTFFYPTYLGLITDDNHELKEVYRTFRGETEEIVIIGYTEPRESLETSVLELVDKRHSTITPLLTIYHGTKQIEAEIPIDCERRQDLSDLVMTTLLDNSKNYQERIGLVTDELKENQVKKELRAYSTIDNNRIIIKN